MTTSQPASPPTANLAISKWPPAQPMRTKPDRANPSPLPHHAAVAADRKPSRQPFRHPHAPTPAGPAVSFQPPVSEKPCLPVPDRPSPPVDLHKSSQRISLRPTMFRAACDNSVTTSQPAGPPTANPSMSKCPPACPVCNQTGPRQPSPLPHHPAVRLTTTHHDTFHPAPPCGTGRVIPLRQIRHSRACGPQHQ